MLGAPTLVPGSFVRFTYHGKRTEDMFKEILVLHPNWMGEVHGLDLKRITPAESSVLQAVFDPASKGKQHQYPLVNDILRRMDPIEEVKNPMSFYVKFVKPFVRNSDCYRRYKVAGVSNVQTIQRSAVEGHMVNPRPLFSK